MVRRQKTVFFFSSDRGVEIIKYHSISNFLLELNMKGSGTNNRLERRRVNKAFMECLLEVQGDRPKALVWLKRHFNSETCKTMRSDWKYKGTI